MSYTKQNFKNGDVLTAEQLNNIEDGLVNLRVTAGQKEGSALGLNATAEGVSTIASGNYSHAEGYGTVASGESSHAGGTCIPAETIEIGLAEETYIGGINCIGIDALLNPDNKYIATSGYGSGQITILNKIQSSGNYLHYYTFEFQYGYDGYPFKGGTATITQEIPQRETSAYGQASHAEGAGTRALVDATHTEGILTLAGRTYEEAQQAAVDLNMSFDSDEELYMKLLGYGAHAEGTNTQALGSSSHAEGSLTQALANSSHAEGDSTYARGEASHAEGYDTTASGNQSHAEGKSTLADGNSSHAEGKESKATGYCAHAEGLNTLAKGLSSHTEGVETIATTEAQHVQGRYNIEDIAGTYAHIVGNGTEEDGRSNAHTLDWDGNAWFAGAINCEDKTTTLANLGAAPAGYGLGGEAEQKDWSEVDSITANGTYRFAGIHQTINGIYVTSATMLVINFGGSYCTQILRTVENASGHYKSYTLVRSKGAIGWDGWECPDPPMSVGVEYRTTERRTEKAVYTKLIEIGQFPNSSQKTVSTGIDASRIFRSNMSAYNYSANAHSPVLYHNVEGQIANYIFIGTDVIVGTNDIAFNGYSGSVQIWYV